MTIFNPPHPGEFIREVYLIPFGLSEREVAKSLKIYPSTFNRLVSGDSKVTPDMACKLSAVLGRSAESWLIMQAQYDLFHSKKNVDLRSLKKINFDNLKD